MPTREADLALVPVPAGPGARPARLPEPRRLPEPARLLEPAPGRLRLPVPRSAPGAPPVGCASSSSGDRPSTESMSASMNSCAFW
ncbi:hypothetical protein COSO111634_35955 [Corallococcus soli]